MPKQKRRIDQKKVDKNTLDKYLEVLHTLTRLEEAMGSQKIVRVNGR